jgi:hypothetical protein
MRTAKLENFSEQIANNFLQNKNNNCDQTFDKFNEGRQRAYDL